VYARVVSNGNYSRAFNGFAWVEYPSVAQQKIDDACVKEHTDIAAPRHTSRTMHKGHPENILPGNTLPPTMRQQTGRERARHATSMDLEAYLAESTNFTTPAALRMPQELPQAVLPQLSTMQQTLERMEARLLAMGDPLGRIEARIDALSEQMAQRSTSPRATRTRMKR
jgi:hypothetical protein